jgi:hypothetical protein
LGIFQRVAETWCWTCTRRCGTSSVTNPEEAIVDFDPDDTKQYLEGVDYPASKEDLASTAEGNGAPEELVERLRTLSRPTFSGPDEVVAELESSPTSG